MRYSGKRCLVTGAAGFIGSNLVRRLLDLNATVLGVDNLLSGKKWRLEDVMNDIYFFEEDLRDKRSVVRIMKKDIDVVFNLAANMGGIGYITGTRADIMHDNVIINANLLWASKFYQPRRIFFSSSACVYPEEKQLDEEVEPLAEEDAIPANPDSCYGWEKLYSERLYLAFYEDYRIETRIGRYHNIFGEFGSYDRKAKAPAHLILKAILYPEIPFIIWGDGAQTRSFCYISDCLDATLKLVGSNIREPLNIGSDRLVTIKELADIIIGISGKEIKVTFDLTKPQGVRGRNADLTRIKKLLGWRPKVSLEEGLKRTYRWTVRNLDKLEFDRASLV